MLWELGPRGREEVQEDVGTLGTQEAGIGDQDPTLLQDKARSSQALCDWAVSCTGHISSSESQFSHCKWT